VGILMVDKTAIDKILHKVEAVNDVENAILISRTGVHITGDLPKGIHLETFVTMCAVLLGAVDIAASELKEKFGSIIVNLQYSRIIVKDVDINALLVVMAGVNADIHSIEDVIDKYTPEIKELL